MSKEKKVQLLKLSKNGSILQFEVIAREVEDGAVLITRKGHLFGGTQEDIEPMYPKNVGRANETSPWGQAEIMLNSKVVKLKDKGYKWINPDLKEGAWKFFVESDLRDYLTDYYGTDDNNNVLPMRAQKDMVKATFPGYYQRKFDGLRAPCKKDNGIYRFRSRYGNWFDNLDHLVPQLPDLPDGWEWDGELYCHGKSLQQIVSMIKTKSTENLKIEYRVYDLITETDENWQYGGMPFKGRLKHLRHYIDLAGPQVKMAFTYWVKDRDQASRLFDRFREEKYEGGMWRDPESVYERGPSRSWGLIKDKDFDEGEYEIVEVEEATGRDEGTAIFVCETKDGKEFNVRPMGSRAKRREYLENFDEECFGKLLTVRHQGWTDDGIPFHARGVVIRDYE